MELIPVSIPASVNMVDVSVEWIPSLTDLARIRIIRLGSVGKFTLYAVLASATWFVQSAGYSGAALAGEFCVGALGPMTSRIWLPSRSYSLTRR